MINDEHIAKEIHALAFEYYKKLHASFLKVKDNCTEEETEAYRKVVGRVMGYSITEIMMPLRSQYPELEPTDDEFKKI